MKFNKICIVFCITVIFVTMCFTVYADNGDVAGKYYSTDIVTFLNGYPIDSINVGGQTLISAEAMQYYGFRVVWNGDVRTLEISSLNFSLQQTPPEVSVNNTMGYYYETDIKTYVNAKEILSYNIGGLTYIHAESLLDFGFNVIWDENARTLWLESPYFAGYVYSKVLFNGEEQTTEAKGKFSLLYNRDGLLGTSDAKYASVVFSGSGTDYCISLGYYQNYGLLYAGKIFDVLEPLTSGGNAHPIFKSYEKYDLVNRNIVFKVNGITAEEVALARYSGNGHKTYYIYAYDLPKFTQDEVYEIYLSVGNQEENTKPFVMEIP